jgi:hypothetical protein
VRVHFPVMEFRCFECLMPYISKLVRDLDQFRYIRQYCKPAWVRVRRRSVTQGYTYPCSSLGHRHCHCHHPTLTRRRVTVVSTLRCCYSSCVTAYHHGILSIDWLQCCQCCGREEGGMGEGLGDRDGEERTHRHGPSRDVVNQVVV